MLVEQVKQLKEVSNKPFFICWSHNKPRLYLQTDNKNISISPRLNIDQMEKWLEAFIAGYEMGKETHR